MKHVSLVEIRKKHFRIQLDSKTLLATKSSARKIQTKFVGT